MHKSSLEITILCDNYVDKPMLVSEHGFSCLIRYNDVNILFDSGQGPAIKNNFGLIKDKKIDFAVLSHGHYDQANGFLNFQNIDLNIYTHKNVFSEHLRRRDDAFDYIGLDKNILKMENIKFILNEDFTEVANNVYLSGSVPRYVDFDADENLFMKTLSGYVKDFFPDEQYLGIKTDKGLVIFTGCSHCGIENILIDARKKFGDVNIYALIGGFHLFRSKTEEVSRIANLLNNSGITKVITGHCTGVDAYYILKEMLKEKIYFSKVGLKFKIV
ncbi:MAG: beta-lactamase domain protein [Deferribacteraceae bacterium]|nr:beta-lactamase domain protein [Deferribacteraceae bacterium]